MPERIARLARDPRGYPIPWFVNRPADGPIDFRVMDPVRFQRAIRERRCWVCGDRLGKHIAFVGGPLSAAERLLVMKNHEVTGILITTGYSKLPRGALVANEPREIGWFHEGRPATRLHTINIAAETDEVKGHPNCQDIIRKLAKLTLPQRG